MKVLVVDDSAYQRLILAAALRVVPPVTSVDMAPTGEAAIRRLLDDTYDLMTLDIEMPGIDGFAVLRWVMENRPLPVLVVTSLSHERVAFAALEAGAYEVLRKPAASVAARTDWKRHLALSVEAACQLRLDSLARRARHGDARLLARRVEPAAGTVSGGAAGLLAIAASTGGPAALRELFASFRRREIAVGVAQHLPAPFTRSLAARLASHTGWDAREAADGDRAVPGTILVAPADHHMEFAGERDSPSVRVRRARSGDRYVPSGDALLSSAATLFGDGTVGVVLTGMGTDGTAGARAIAEVGGMVIAESPETAVISGMPDSAAQAARGAIVLPLGAIGRELDRRFPLATLSRFHE
jgi:two-component system, chemotaxis family, protein-glutamate methylesterase/glutaminase